MPDTPGMRTSISTTSGASSTMQSTASCPSPVSPTTTMSASSSSTSRPPRRNGACGSASRTRIGASTVTSPGGLDQAEATVSPAVDHGRDARVGVGEEEEVVAEQLHLEHGFLDVHGLHAELLGLHHGSRLVVVLRVGKRAVAVGLGRFGRFGCDVSA